MYTQHFGLQERPFSITPDPRYLYLSSRHREALAHLHFGIDDGGGFVQLTGDVGTGKTTVCRALLEQLPPHVDTALVFNPAVTSQELLQTVCEELLIDAPPDCRSTTKLVERLNEYLLDANARGRRTILIIDEAQNLSKEVLEQVRLLTNLETAETKLLQIFLIGQPELRELISDKTLRQVAQRVTARYHLKALDWAETQQYIRHRLAVAGASHMPFSRTALRRIYHYSQGVPRVINILADRALLGAYSSGRNRVSGRIVKKAFLELSGDSGSSGWTWAAAFTITAVVALGLGLTRGLFEVPGITFASDASSVLAPKHLTTGNIRDVPEFSSVEPVHVSVDESPRIAVRQEPHPKPPDATAHTEAPDGLPATRPAAAADRLLAAWGIPARSSSEIPLCDWAELQGLRCLVGQGDWADLRRLNRPAIISLRNEQGRLSAAVVMELTEINVTLGTDSSDIRLPLSEATMRWNGDYLLLWKPPLSKVGLIRSGSAGPPVLWLRQALDRIDGGSEPANSLLAFDNALKKRLEAFQRSRDILADGVAGRETLIQLNTVLGDPEIPLLWVSPTS